MIQAVKGFILYYLLFCPTTGTQDRRREVPAVVFQTDGLPSNSSFARAVDSLPRLDALSLCTHIRLVQSREAIMPLLSYATPEFSDELLVYLHVIDGRFQMVCCGGAGRFESDKIQENVPMFIWLHFCAVIDLRLLMYKIYLNDRIISGEIRTSTNKGLSIEEGGVIILGQEQDLYGEGFSASQSFEGILADYNIVFGIADTHSIENFIKCDSYSFEDVIVSFENFSQKWSVNGSVESTSYQANDICQTSNSTFVVFAEFRSLEDSAKLCNKLKGEIALPKNDQQNKELVELMETKKKRCTVGWNVCLWLGARGYRTEEGRWVYKSIVTNELLNYTNFRSGFNNPVSTSECIYFDSFAAGIWVQYPCSFKTCVACSFKTRTVQRLRGLCEDSNIDRYYVINGEYNGQPLFSGVSHTVIRATNTTWELVDSFYPGLNASMLATERHQNPVGLRRWKINGDKCEQTAIELLLTACKADQYTCNDGTCIDKMQRCDLQVNCPDQSDERLCSPVVMPGDYIKEVPPARVGKKAAPVQIEVNILSLQPVDTMNMFLTLTLIITLVWKDPRVNMESLNYDENLNVIRSDELWQPNLLFEDEYHSEATLELLTSNFQVVMESEPLADDITRVREDEVYPGTRNSLKLIQSFSLQYACQMNLVAYPFDTQSCTFLIRLVDVPNDFVKLEHAGEGVTYSGPPNLREYAVRKVDMFSDDRGNFSGKGIRLVLENLSGFYVSTTYIPTFLMVAICYSTFYYNLDDFNDRIMVSLTALLVLATLFTQITATTPKTAYLKLLDVWFVSTILVNFFIVLVLVTINFFKIREGFADFNMDTPVFSITKHPVHHPPEEKTPRMSLKINYYSQVSIPVIVAFFTIMYVAIALWIM
ncbi:Low-density lipoprotein (LDL) receptor class A repeat [Trinorchestia longiramus]|nr:Low-density lipoprotein (LDL) receptor class A repeat [Trinorchestia longiramus]